MRQKPAVKRCIGIMQTISTPFGHDRDNEFMHHALAYAQQAYAADEVPVGAVVVDGHGVIIGHGYNQVEALKTQTAHAEMRAIVAATHARNDWRLDGCWLYVTLEPCTMCMGLITVSRMAGVVFGAASPLFGYRLDNDGDNWLYKKIVRSYAPDAVQTIEGIGAEQAAQLLKDFFKKQRKRRG
jgi:tRNA(adenine34) deaminase